jgi:zinc protease
MQRTFVFRSRRRRWFVPARVAFAASAALLLLAAACGGQSPDGGAGGDHDGAVLLPVADDPTVSFCIWFQVGSQNDPPGKEGLSYVTGHLLAEGSTQNNSYEEILVKLYPLASTYDVRVDREMTTFRGRTHVDNMEKFYALFTDAFLRPSFDEKDFERIRNDALNSIKNTLRYSSDEELGKATLYDFVFTGTSYSHPREGTVQGLESLSIDDVKAFYNQYYTTENAVVALGGGYPSELPERIQTAMDALPAGQPARAPKPRAAAINGRNVVLVSRPGADASISFGFPIDVQRGEREFYALWVANSWLGEHRNSSSHLYQVIRSARGMNYGDYSYIEAYPEGGFRQLPPQNVARRQQCFEIWIRTLPNDQAVFATRAAMRELQKLVDNGMSAEDFELTRSFLYKYVLHFAETTAQRLRYAVDDRFYGIDGSHLQRFREILPTLTHEEVNAAIQKHLQYDNMKIAIVTGDAELIKRQLASDEATPMDYESQKPDEVLEEDKEISTLALKIAEANIHVVPVDQMFEN